jgi:hypothetical protein
MAMKNQNGSKTLKRLASEYRSLGLSETEARLAAQIEDAVRDVEESSRNLHLAAKSIGITGEAAKALCHSDEVICI